MSDCRICAKHADPANAEYVVAEDEHVVLCHHTDDYLGYLFVESRRHVAGLGDLTPDEAAAVGEHAARAARALRHVLGAEHVYAAVIGHGIAHFHLHVIARHPGTPREFWWTKVDEWPDAPRGDPRELVRRLRGAPEKPRGPARPPENVSERPPVGHP